MLGNRHLQIRLAKDEKSTATAATPTTTPAEWSAIAERLGTKAVLGTVVVVASTIALKTASEILISRLR